MSGMGARLSSAPALTLGLGHLLCLLSAPTLRALTAVPLPPRQHCNQRALCWSHHRRFDCSRSKRKIQMVSDDVVTATSLFNNMRIPASVLAGAMVPLGFGFELPPTSDKRLLKLHRIVAAISYSCLLVCIVYASMAVNSLAETHHEPSRTVTELIKREYELEWVATNATFLLGLFGCLVLVSLRMLAHKSAEGRVAAGFCSGALLLMLNIFDEQVRRGGYASNVVELVLQYWRMTNSHAAATRNSLLVAAIALLQVSTAGAVMVVAFAPQDELDSVGADGRPAGSVSTSQADVVAGVGSLGPSSSALASSDSTATDQSASVVDGDSAGGIDFVDSSAQTWP